MHIARNAYEFSMIRLNNECKREPYKTQALIRKLYHQKNRANAVFLLFSKKFAMYKSMLRNR